MTVFKHTEATPGGDAPVALIDAARKHLPKLFRVALDSHMGRGGWKRLARAVDVTQPDESDLELEGVTWSSAEEIAQAVWELIAEHADQRQQDQPSLTILRYRADFLDRDLERLGQQVPVTIRLDEVDGSLGAGDGSREDQIVDMSRLARQIAADSHDRHMRTMDRQEKLMDGAAKLAEVNVKGTVELARFEHELKMKELEVREVESNNIMSIARWQAIFGPVTVIGSKLGEMFASIFKTHLEGMFAEAAADFSGSAPPSSGSFAGRISAIMTRETTDRDAIADALAKIEPELVSLLAAMCDASDDATFQNIGQEFRKRVFQALSSGTNPEAVTAAFEQSMSAEDWAALAALFKEAGIL